MLLSPRPLALAACAVVTAALLVSPTSSATAAAATCEGRAATVTAGADNRYQGTDGSDVVVATGRTPSVNTGGGDDLVCVASADFATVYAGSGADRVVVTDDSSDYRRFRVELGEGDDIFRGGPGQDIVGSLEYDPIFYEQGFDTLDTGAGNDQATVGDDELRNHRVDLDLGPGDDGVSFYGGGVTADSVVEGGSGRDYLGFNAYDEGTDVAIDAVDRTIDRGGRVVSGWSSFEAYGIKEFDAAVSFRGTDAPEYFFPYAARSYDVDMGGGDDTLQVEGPRGGSASGGTGRDRIVDGSARRVDLAKGTLGRFRISSFQDATSTQGPVTGDGQANDLVIACSTARGGGGADRITKQVSRSAGGPASCARFAAYGGRGDDVLRGAAGVDRLIGGPGSDLAVGRGGRDVCVAERERSC